MEKRNNSVRTTKQIPSLNSCEQQLASYKECSNEHDHFAFTQGDKKILSFGHKRSLMHSKKTVDVFRTYL